jgi:hypothetical protein
MEIIMLKLMSSDAHGALIVCCEQLKEAVERNPTAENIKDWRERLTAILKLIEN